MCNVSSNSDAADAEIEPIIRRIWLDSLSIADIKPGDDFIKLGGDSLRAMQVVSRVHEELGVEVPLARLLQASNFREFCVCVERKLQEHLSNLSDDELLSLTDAGDQPEKPSDL